MLQEVGRRAWVCRPYFVFLMFFFLMLIPFGRSQGFLETMLNFVLLRSRTVPYPGDGMR